VKTSSGIEIREVYGPESLREFSPEEKLGRPGEYPFTRGIYPNMYRGRLWTMRQYAGFGSTEETNRRFRYLLEKGQTGLSVAFDLPTQLGLDSDDPLAEGEVGRTGVAISTVQDMERLFDHIEMDKISTSMTINATALPILAMYVVAGERRNISGDSLSGTVQNDILKEYTSRGNYIFPVQPSMRLTVDLIEYCTARIPRWNTVSISGYHMREAGATAVQEIAYTLSDAISIVEEVLKRGIDVDVFAPRLSFFFSCHIRFFEETAKFRAARRIWARTMTERFNARNEKAKMLRFHTQTSGVTLTAQQPENNIIRVALQAAASVLGGSQSIHTNSYDEALALPTEKAATLALRTQQIIGYESGIPDTVDPLAGSYFIESLTNQIENATTLEMDKVEKMGGAVECVKNGYFKAEIEKSAYRDQMDVESGRRRIVGVTDFASDTEEKMDILRVDPVLTRKRADELSAYRSRRDKAPVDQALRDLEREAHTGKNLMEPVLQAFRADATLGEVCTVLKGVFGKHEEIS
jgi:methylmalonyl-CoA mutase N-terminal domain/subunit